MSIDNLRSALPEWAKDLSLNLSTLSRSSSLTEQQQWGTFVAAAAATRNESVLVQVMEDARTHLSEEAISAALGAAAGAIGLAVAIETTRTEVWAVEKEAEPFALACQNRDAVGVPCLHLERGDATDPATLAHLDGMVDVVVTNPPYVPADEMPTQPEASADPHVALYGGSPDGTEIPARVARRALTLLRPGGVLLMEHSPTQEEAMAALAAELGMTDITTLPDLAGRRRFLSARVPESTKPTASVTQ